MIIGFVLNLRNEMHAVLLQCGTERLIPQQLKEPLN